MNITVSRLAKREDKDPEGAAYWLLLEHVSGVSWKVPVSKTELFVLQRYLPKALKGVY